MFPLNAGDTQAPAGLATLDQAADFTPVQVVDSILALVVVCTQDQAVAFILVPVADCIPDLAGEFMLVLPVEMERTRDHGVHALPVQKDPSGLGNTVQIELRKLIGPRYLNCY